VQGVNTVLALLSVLLIELGGSVSLAIGMAFSIAEMPAQNVTAQPTSTVQEVFAGSAQVKPVRTVLERRGAANPVRTVSADVQAPTVSPVRERLLADVRGTSGGLRGTRETLAVRYNVSPTRITQVLKQLQSSGAVRVRVNRSGTVVTPVIGLAAVS
jgi:hypothetical protein